MAIIAVCNQKGGCGKTTIAINLAQAYVADGCAVLFLDLDPPGQRGRLEVHRPGPGAWVSG